MASEYLKWKYRDVKPEEPVALSPAEKRRNWWHYHRWQLVLTAALLLIAADLLCSALGVGRREPDCQIAYVSASPLPGDTAAALELALASYGSDANGDGTVYIQLNQYVLNAMGGENSRYAEANNIRLLADLEDCDSFLFLTEDYETFQKFYGVLCYPDGSLPPWGDDSGEGCALRWTDCPVPAGLDLGNYTETAAGVEITGDSQALLAPLYLARRGFWTENTVRYPDACTALWQALIENTEYDMKKTEAAS